MRKRRCMLVGVLGGLCMVGWSASAVRAQRPVELGVIAGEPTGLSVKVWTSGRQAWDAAAAWSFDDDTALNVHGDYLVHFFDRLDIDQPGQLPFYVGIGGRIKFRDTQDDLVGIRLPIGLAYLMEETPLSFFLEVAPVLDVAPETEVRVNAALGLRYVFGAR